MMWSPEILLILQLAFKRIIKKSAGTESKLQALSFHNTTDKDARYEDECKAKMRGLEQHDGSEGP